MPPPRAQVTLCPLSPTARPVHPQHAPWSSFPHFDELPNKASKLEGVGMFVGGTRWVTL